MTPMLEQTSMPGSRRSSEGSAPAGVTHLFTVDVEEYFQVQALAPYVPRDSWDSRPSRVAESTERVLGLLERVGVHGTFFILGCVAEKHPRLVARIAGAGHEVASHGWSHSRVTALSADAFRDEVRNTKRCLEDIAGAKVTGYRAPSFSIIPGFAWALDVLREEGHTYDSSLFPIRRPGYGHPAAHTAPFLARRPGGDLVEFPPATIDVGNLRLPAGGGGYLRQFPFSITRHAYRVGTAKRVPTTLYIHPWELDPEQPRVAVPLLTRIRHYRGLDRAAARLEMLLAEFPFTSIERWMGALSHEERAALPVRSIN